MPQRPCLAHPGRHICPRWTRDCKLATMPPRPTGPWPTSAAINSRGGLLVLSLAVGIGAGLGAVVFRYMIEVLTWVFTGYVDYGVHGSVANPNLPSLGRWFVVVTPVVAGLLYGPLVHRFAREARGGGISEVMAAIARSGGRIRPRVATVKVAASALCIGGGGSVGREGPIVQIGSALGSAIAQWARLDERHIKLLVACGTAAGIAATFNAPLAGVFFAMEVILRAWATEAFGMVVLASVTASVISRVILGNSMALTLPAFDVEHLVQYPLFALLGVLAGLVGVGFSRTLSAIQDVCDWAWRGPEWARPAVGGILLGGVLLVLPEMYGGGFPVLSRAVANEYTIGFLLLLLVGKIVACSLTLGIGGSGGVFTPSLFCGAMLGAAFGAAVQQLMPTLGGSVGAYAVVGMAAVFAGAARAPIAAIVILVELTGQYAIVLPLMLAVVLAAGVSNLISYDTIFTRKLLRRGIDIDEPADAALRRIPARDLMRLPPATIRLPSDVTAAARIFAAVDERHLPVLDEAGHYYGTLAAHAVMAALAAGQTTAVATLTTAAEPITATSPMGDVIRRLDHDDSAVAVTDAAHTLIGWISLRDVLIALAPGKARPS